MKYEEVLRWRMDVYEASLGAFNTRPAVPTRQTWTVQTMSDGAPPAFWKAGGERQYADTLLSSSLTNI